MAIKPRPSSLLLLLLPTSQRSLTSPFPRVNALVVPTLPPSTLGRVVRPSLDVSLPMMVRGKDEDDDRATIPLLDNLLRVIFSSIDARMPRRPSPPEPAMSSSSPIVSPPSDVSQPRELHDANPVSVEAAAVAAELAWKDGSSSSSIPPSRLEGVPASFDHRGGWDRDFVVDDACGDEFDDSATVGEVEVDVGARGADGSIPASSATSFCNNGDESVQRLVEMRRLSARETYMAHRKYFDGSASEDSYIVDISVAGDGNDRCKRVSHSSPGIYRFIDNISIAYDENDGSGRAFEKSPCEDGCIDDISHPHEGNDGSRVFITKKALTLARSLKLDVYDIFMNMKEHAFASDTTVDMAKVTEGDVRDYLDRRYDRLISLIAMDDNERVDTQKNRNPYIDYERHNNANFSLRRTNEVHLRNNWRESEGIDSSSTARRRERPYRRQSHRQQEHHRTVFDSLQQSSNDYGYNQGEDQSFRRGMHGRENRMPLMLRRPVHEAKSRTHSIGSVPLSKLVSKSRSEPHNSLESRDISQFRRTSRKNFRNTYRVEQEQQRSTVEESQYPTAESNA